MNQTHRARYNVLLSLLIGFLAFLLVADLAVLNPQYADWLMEGDPATAFLGWQFFRTAPLWQWPLGANPNYGMEISSSIIFSDSIPLLAFLFKPISAYLPDVFQYYGLWICICFLLQAHLAWRLLSKFTQDPWLPLLGCAFFSIAPFCLWRLNCHYALFGQWVILAALCLYFRKKHSIGLWVLLLGATALIHAYLLVMVLAIWIADMTQRLLMKEHRFLQIIGFFFLGTAVTALVMWAAGYFMLMNGIQSGGFGWYRMNLLAIIDPDTLWSKIFKDQNGGPGDYEGFNFLGIGIIGLALLSCCELIRSRKIGFEIKLLPLCVLSLFFFLYALSNKIAIGPHEILSYPFPAFAAKFAGVFRVSARFIWPVSYIVYLCIFYLVFTRMQRRPAIVVCLLFLMIQIVDSKDAISFFNNKFSKHQSFMAPLRSAEWRIIAGNYKKVVLILPKHIPDNWMVLSELAIANHMSINIAYCARIDDNKLKQSRVKLTETIKNNNLDPETLYFFEDNDLWNCALAQLKGSSAQFMG